METPKYKAGDFVSHILNPRVKLLVVDKSDKYLDYYYCRQYSSVTGSFLLLEFYGFELSLAR